MFWTGRKGEIPVSWILSSKVKKLEYEGKGTESTIVKYSEQNSSISSNASHIDFDIIFVTSRNLATF